MNLHKIIIEKIYAITDEHRQICFDIASACNNFDGLNISFFIEDEESENTNVLTYFAKIKDKVVGFINTYYICDGEIEICAFVHPDYRSSHILNLLFKELKKDYAGFTILLPINKSSSFYDYICKKFNFAYDCTELKMYIDSTLFQNQGHTLAIHKEISADSICYSAFDNDVRVGALSVFPDNNVAVIHDVFVYEEFRRKGFGSQLVCFAIHDLLKRKDSILLHVTKENTAAYKLYCNLGFIINESLVYYSLHL